MQLDHHWKEFYCSTDMFVAEARYLVPVFSVFKTPITFILTSNSNDLDSLRETLRIFVTSGLNVRLRCRISEPLKITLYSCSTRNPLFHAGFVRPRDLKTGTRDAPSNTFNMIS